MIKRLLSKRFCTENTCIDGKSVNFTFYRTELLDHQNHTHCILFINRMPTAQLHTSQLLHRILQRTAGVARISITNTKLSHAGSRYRQIFMVGYETLLNNMIEQCIVCCIVQHPATIIMTCVYNFTCNVILATSIVIM